MGVTYCGVTAGMLKVVVGWLFIGDTGGGGGGGGGKYSRITRTKYLSAIVVIDYFTYLHYIGKQTVLFIVNKIYIYIYIYIKYIYSYI